MVQALKQIAVCMFTAFEEPTLVTKCAALGARGHILKPLTPLKLRGVVHDVFPNVILRAPDGATSRGFATPLIDEAAPPAVESENPNLASVWQEGGFHRQPPHHRV